MIVEIARDRSRERPSALGTWLFRARAESLPLVRDAVRGFDLGALEHDVTLLVTELVSNAIRHAGLRRDAPVKLRIAADERRVRIEVSDPGCGFDATSLDDETQLEEPGGLGLVLVDRMSERWGIIRGAETRVWLEMPRPARAAA